MTVCDYLASTNGGGAERVAVEVNRRLRDEHGIELLAMGMAPRRPALRHLAFDVMKRGSWLEHHLGWRLSSGSMPSYEDTADLTPGSSMLWTGPSCDQGIGHAPTKICSQLAALERQLEQATPPKASRLRTPAEASELHGPPVASMRGESAEASGQQTPRGPRWPRASPKASRLAARGLREPAPPEPVRHEPVLIPGIDLSGLLGVQLAVAPRMAQVLARHARDFQPDLIHAHGMYFHGTVAAAAVARQLDLPFVVTAHIGSPRFLATPVRAAMAAWDTTIGRRLLSTAAVAVAVSPSVADYLVQLGFDSTHIVVAPNGVDHAVYHPAPGPPRDPSSLPGPHSGIDRASEELGTGSHGGSSSTSRVHRRRTGALEVVFVGRLMANKGPEVALAAMAAVKRSGVSAHLTVVGDGPLKSELHRRAHALGIAESTTFTGMIDDVATHLRLADVLLRPSRTEGMPLAVLEAMACGAVVVCSAVPGNLDLVRPEHNGLVFPSEDEVGAAACVCRLAVEHGLLDRLRQAAFADAAAYTWTRSAAGHLRAFEQALASPVRRRARAGADTCAAVRW